MYINPGERIITQEVKEIIIIEYLCIEITKEKEKEKVNKEVHSFLEVHVLCTCCVREVHVFKFSIIIQNIVFFIIDHINSFLRN